MAQKEMNLSPELIAEAVKRVMASMVDSKVQPAAPVSGGGSARPDARKDYPLALKHPDRVRSASGKKLDEVTLDKVLAGQIGFDDVKISPETLEFQAGIAESVGRPRLAANMRRAAEMTRIPDERILEMYNALRPYRSTRQELLDMAAELETKYGARVCSALVREAAEIYEKRGRLKR
ncbi:MAG: diol dehydratase small subunit [Syntrophobacteraceae bacterium]|nr:diol dehydratase small subunit [Syntrophobacteraceae bacterium]